MKASDPNWERVNQLQEEITYLTNRQLTMSKWNFRSVEAYLDAKAQVQAFIDMAQDELDELTISDFVQHLDLTYL